MRGISEQISITFGDSVYVFEPGMDNRGIDNTGVHAIADLSELKNNKKLPYEVKIKLKGSQSINFIPLGKTTRVDLKANWNTPSFTGSYLPNNRGYYRERIFGTMASLELEPELLTSND